MDAFKGFPCWMHSREMVSITAELFSIEIIQDIELICHKIWSKNAVGQLSLQTIDKISAATAVAGQLKDNHPNNHTSHSIIPNQR